jgi:hypothetical protein
MKKSFLSSLFSTIGKAHRKFSTTDWANPKNTLILVALIAFPFVAWYYISTGFVIGLLMSVCILWLLEKSPYFVKYLVSRFPFAADLTLSTLVVVMFGGYFGSGLTLGIGAICTAIILSWGLQAFADRFYASDEHKEYETAHAT